MIFRPRLLYRTFAQVLGTRQYWTSFTEAFRFFRRFNAHSQSQEPDCEFALKGIRFHVRPTDYYAFKEILLDDEYGFIRPILDEVPKPPFIVDIGSNIGLFAVYALSIDPKARVHSFEPASDTYAQLAKNRAANAACLWTIHKLAMWREETEISFESAGFSTGGKVSKGGPGSESVKAVSLPFLFSGILAEDDIHLMKIDIEGAEEAFLAGMGPKLGKIRNLIIEVHPNACDHRLVIRELASSFPYIYEIPGRISSKPLLLCSRIPRPYKPLPVE